MVFLSSFLIVLMHTLHVDVNVTDFSFFAKCLLLVFNVMVHVSGLCQYQKKIVDSTSDFVSLDFLSFFVF